MLAPGKVEKGKKSLWELHRACWEGCCITTLGSDQLTPTIVVKLWGAGGSIPQFLDRIPEKIDDIEHNYNYTGGSQL